MVNHFNQAPPPIDLQRLENALSSVRREWIFTETDECPKTLLEALIKRFPQIDESSWSERFEFGGIFINGRAAYSDRPLTTPCRLEYFEPRFPIAKAKDYFPSFDPDWIVHQDSDFMVVVKPAGLPCLPNREQRHFHLKGYLEQWIGHAVHLPSRVDTSTRGLVVVSNSKRMNAPLQQAFEKRLIGKFYLLETSPPFPRENVELKCLIGEHETHSILRKVVERDGLEAHTIFVRLDADNASSDMNPERSLVLARPLTGRTHQLRVQSRYLGAPILGDPFYGGVVDKELHLMSFRLLFDHPFLKKRLDIRCPDSHLPDWVSTLQAEDAEKASCSLL